MFPACAGMCRGTAILPPWHEGRGTEPAVAAAKRFFCPGAKSPGENWLLRGFPCSHSGRDCQRSGQASLMLVISSMA